MSANLSLKVCEVCCGREGEVACVPVTYCRPPEGSVCMVLLCPVPFLFPFHLVFLEYLLSHRHCSAAFFRLGLYSVLCMPH